MKFKNPGASSLVKRDTSSKQIHVHIISQVEIIAQKPEAGEESKGSEARGVRR